MNSHINSGSYIRKTNELLKGCGLGVFLHYQTYDEEYELFINRNSYGFILEVGVFTGFNEEVERELSGLFKNILPEGSSIQFLLVASSRVGKILDKWEDARKNNPGLLYELAKERKAFFARKATDGEDFYRLRNFRLIISCSTPGSAPNDFELSKFNELKVQVETVFAVSGVGAKICKPVDLIRLLDELLNYDGTIKNSELTWNKNQAINEQIISPVTHRVITNKSIILNEDEWEYRFYDIKKYPRQWYLGGMSKLIGDNIRDLLQIPCQFAISYSVYIENSKIRKTALMTKGARVEAQAASVLGKWIPALRKEAEEYRFVIDQFEQNERLVKTDYKVMLLDKPANINKSEQLLINLYRSNSWDLILSRFIVLPSLVSILPLSWGEGMAEDMSFFKKAKTTLSHEPVNLLPLQAEFKGTNTPSMLLAGRRGQIFYWNPFDNSSGNFNVCVVGKPGSGKSVFMQELATSILGLGGHIYVLDVGHSFEKQVKFLGGQFIEFGTKSNLCINPFSTINDQDEENVTDSLSILKPIISLMIAPKRGTTDEEDAIIERGLSQTWKKKGKKAGISDLADWLLAEPDLTANNLGNMLFPYSLQGAYGKFFNGEATVNFAAEFVVTELQELKERKDLLAVVVQIFILQMTNKIILGDRSTPTGIVFDELWKLLRGKQGSEFIEELARTLRKYNGSLIVGTQNLSDFYKNPGAEAAFNNSDWLCMFAQKKEAIEILKQSGKFSIDEYTQNLLSSVRTKQGEYSEVMIMHESGSALGRLILDPFSRILYSSKADEFAAVKGLEAEGLTLAEAIRKVSEVKYGNAC